MQPPRRATVITDASFCPKAKVGAWAAWIRVDGMDKAIRGSGQLPFDATPDSTVAEVMAAGNGCWLAAQQGATHLLLQSDCMAVIHLVEKRAKAERLLALWDHLLKLPDMAGVQNIMVRHVKGHGVVKDRRTFVNAWCDSAAYAELEKARAARKAHSRHRPKG